MNPQNFPQDVLTLIFKYLQLPEELTACGLTCKQWYQASIADTLWSHHCKRSEITATIFTPTPKTHRETYQRFREIYVGYTDAYPKVKRCMRRLEKWLQKYAPQLFATLAPPLEWKKPLFKSLENETINFPKEFELWYHLHDGERGYTGGLFGVYHCYGIFCCLLWISSIHLRKFEIWSLEVVVFGWCRYTGKSLALVVNCPPTFELELLHHVIEFDEITYKYQDKGVFMDFIEEYVDNLEMGVFSLTPQKQILMFPNEGLGTSRAVTKGIEVQASAIYASESQRPYTQFIYRIRMNLLSPSALGYPSCQLVSRYWLIRFESGNIDEVEGEAVIGEYPLLSRSTPSFEYCSICADSPNTIDKVYSMKGHFIFVPGSIENPVGPSFQVNVAEYRLPQPVSFPRMITYDV
ncbi:F-box protein skip16 [Basidiobolus ranarum]|uniref:F-box protein skip16 n=1 Tax=Basidiobolus ranarum TaxID=34480 RepID=A0ABR2W276_9FUNG